LIPHGKVLSPLDYTSTLPALPNPPNPKCPASRVHSTCSSSDFELLGDRVHYILCVFFGIPVQAKFY
jgi:hypothetical protein